MEMPPALGNKMQVDDGASALSSSSISSPPNSPPQINGSSDTIRVSRPSLSNSGDGVGNLIPGTPAQASAATNATAHVANGNISTQATTKTNGTAPEKPKRQRKKKESGPDGKPVAADDKPKEKKPRKPRDPKDKPAGAGGEKTTAPRKKKIKTEEKTPAAHDASTQSRQPTIMEMVGTFTQPNQPASSIIPSQPQHRLSDNTTTQSSIPPRLSNPPTPRPVSSGQNYDPIRGSTMENALPRLSNPRDGVTSAQTSPRFNRASASPAIASLIDPPAATKGAAPPPAHYSPQTAMQQPSFVPSQRSPPPPIAAPTFAPPPQSQPSPPVQTMQPAISATDGAMDVDGPTCESTKLQQIPEIKAHSSSSAPTPKAARPTPPPPKGTGSGLLSTSDLFGGPSIPESVERKGVNIDIQIPLNPSGGNTINIAQEIIRKYGRDAINPRAAAHRERIMRFAAEQRQFRESNDDMSVDLTSELEGDSNTEMGGMDDDKSNTGMDNDSKPVRKRRKKVEEYDKEDDFIDDTELAWQEQAAVAKDGFFVYSGPLVPEGQQAQVESSSSTRGSRGGRARGRGSRSTTTGSTHASLAEKSRDSTTSTRSRARGTRGTGAPRKPRITKADRERMEAEKADRERAGAGMGGPTTAPVTLAPSLPQGSPMQQQQLPPPQQSYAQPTGTVT